MMEQIFFIKHKEDNSQISFNHTIHACCRKIDLEALKYVSKRTFEKTLRLKAL